jgi:hypothetical protein
MVASCEGVHVVHPAGSSHGVSSIKQSHQWLVLGWTHFFLISRLPLGRPYHGKYIRDTVTNGPSQFTYV